MNTDWNYSNLISAIKKFQYVAHNCAERVDIERATGGSDNERRFRAMYSTTDKLCSRLSRPTQDWVNFTYEA